MLNQFSKVAAVAVSAMLCCASVWAELKCHEVAGGITTNFVDSSDTLGSATGDLAGGLGVHVFNQQQGSGGTILLTVHHHWVTATGELVPRSGDRDAVPNPCPRPLRRQLSGWSQPQRVRHRTLRRRIRQYLCLGAVDLGKGEVVLRYSGSVCHAE